MPEEILLAPRNGMATSQVSVIFLQFVSRQVGFCNVRHFQAGTKTGQSSQELKVLWLRKDFRTSPGDRYLVIWEEWVEQLDPALVVVLPRSLPVWCCQKTSVIKPETPFVNPMSIYSMRYKYMRTRTTTAQDKVCLWATRLMWASRRPPFQKGWWKAGMSAPMGRAAGSSASLGALCNLTSLEEDQARAHLSRQRFM